MGTENQNKKHPFHRFLLRKNVLAVQRPIAQRGSAIVP
jgi:hypothetical protein